MATNQKLQIPVYTYEFMPVEKPQNTLFESKGDIEKRIEELKQHKQEIMQKYIDRIANGELVPKLGNKEFRCKTLYNSGGVTIFKMENIKDEAYDWNFGVERHKIGPNCHVIIDNRKDMQHIAIEREIPCGFFSLEMSGLQIGQRLVSQVARVSGKKIRNGMLKLEDFKKIQDAAGLVYNSPLYIVDVPNMKLLDIRAMARRMKVNQKVEIIFIDYIGLITSENPDAQMFEQQSAISKSLKSLARELDIPIVVLCQVARAAEGDEPNLAQLRGSGSIEQDADVVMFIHGDRKANKETNEGYDPVQQRKIIVAKQRNGPVGDVDVIFLSNYTKFENKSREEQ